MDDATGRQHAAAPTLPNQALRVENQQLRDELARLKGGSGKPDVKPPTPAPPPPDHSSEAQRRTPKPRQKGRKIGILTPTRTAHWVVDPASLPPDAIRHDTTEVMVRDLLLQPEIIRFVREVFLVPSTGATITAPLPEGYHGQFGPHIQALTLTLGHAANVSQPSLLTFFQDAGIAIGKGTIARWLRDHRATWVAEAQAIHQAGLASSDWQATDQAPTRVDGQNETCHVLGNPYFTVYQTRPGGTRQDVLAVLWGQEPRFRLNADALAWLDATRIGRTLITHLAAILPWDTALTATDLTSQLDAAGVTLGLQQRQQVWDALARPPSERVSQILSAIVQAHKAGTLPDFQWSDLAGIEGDDLQAVWEPIMSNHPMWLDDSSAPLGR